MDAGEQRSRHLVRSMHAKAEALSALVDTLVAELHRARHNQASWRQVHALYAQVAQDLSALAGLLQEGQTGLRSVVVTPAQVSMEPDGRLAQLTQGRVQAFTHTVPPDHLRTRPEQAVEEAERRVLESAVPRTVDQVNKHVANTFNKHLDNFAAHIADLLAPADAAPRPAPPAHRLQDTMALVRMLNSPVEATPVARPPAR